VNLKAVQDRLPEYWTDQSYPDSFNQEPLPHRHFNHALTHCMKALGGLAALSDALDHARMMNRGYSDPEAERLHVNAGKYLADLVICAQLCTLQSRVTSYKFLAKQIVRRLIVNNCVKQDGISACICDDLPEDMIDRAASALQEPLEAPRYWARGLARVALCAALSPCWDACKECIKAHP